MINGDLVTLTLRSTRFSFYLPPSWAGRLTQSTPVFPYHPSSHLNSSLFGIKKNCNGRGGKKNSSSQYNQSFLQNPYYFMYASLASPERDEELHLLKDGKTRCTTGSVVSSLYHLKDPEADGAWSLRFFFLCLCFCSYFFLLLSSLLLSLSL